VAKKKRMMMPHHPLLTTQSISGLLGDRNMDANIKTGIATGVKAICEKYVFVLFILSG
jgi:hypothetical protein